MSLADDYVLTKMVVQVRYRDGIVYLDKCGSLQLALLRVLGEPFKAEALPTIDHGEIKSRLERIVVHYGSDLAIIDQTWLETPARVQALAPKVWAEIAKFLGVEGKVARCGMRMQMQWAVETSEEAEEILVHCGLVQYTDLWQGILGKTKARSFVGVSEVGGGRSLRAELLGLKTVVESRVWPEDERYVPPCAIQLDLDFGLEEPGKLDRDMLREFLAQSIGDARRVAEKIGEALHAGSHHE